MTKSLNECLEETQRLHPKMAAAVDCVRRHIHLFKQTDAELDGCGFIATFAVPLPNYREEIVEWRVQVGPAVVLLYPFRLLEGALNWNLRRCLVCESQERLLLEHFEELVLGDLVSAS